MTQCMYTFLPFLFLWSIQMFGALHITPIQHPIANHMTAKANIFNSSYIRPKS